MTTRVLTGTYSAGYTLSPQFTVLSIAATALIEGLGGKVESFYFGFGASDVFVIADMPDNVSVAAAALAVSAGGGARARTVVLLTASELDAAAKKQTTYRAPGS